MTLITSSIWDSLRFQPLTRQTASQIVTWQYPPPYAIYSYDVHEQEENIAWLLTPHYHYYAVFNNANELIGYRCFGEDARVLGGDYTQDALDMGGGLRPDLTGQGLGAGFMQAAFDFARAHFNPVRFRATVMSANKRALRVCLKVGYQPTQIFTHPRSHTPFTVLTRPVHL